MSSYTKYNQRPNGYWTHDKVVEELQSFISKEGFFPSRSNPIYSYLLNPVNKYGGINYFRKLLNFEILHQNGKWNNFEDVKKAIEDKFPDLIQNLIMPTKSMLRCTSLDAAVVRHGGIRKVAKLMGCINNIRITSDGHFVDSSHEYLLDEYMFSRGIKHDVHGLICSERKFLYDFKVDDNYFEIWGYEDDVSNLRCKSYNKKRIEKEILYKKLGLKLVSIEKKIFHTNCNDIEKYFDKLFLDLGYDTSVKITNFTLKKINYVNFFKELKENEVIDKIKTFIDEYKKFPTDHMLRKMNMCDLRYAIERCGGYTKFRKLLNYKIKTPKGYWNEELIYSEIKEVISDINKFPTDQNLRALNLNSLKSAIEKNGGLNYYKEKYKNECKA